jgi:O-antigen ligase
MNDAQTQSEQRKQLLIQEGRAMRGAVLGATQQIKSGLQPGNMLGALGTMGWFGPLAQAGLGLFNGIGAANGTAKGALGGLNLQIALPLLVGGVKLLRKTSRGKPVMRGMLVAGLAAVVAVLVVKQRRATREAEQKSEQAAEQDTGATAVPPSMP